MGCFALSLKIKGSVFAIFYSVLKQYFVYLEMKSPACFGTEHFKLIVECFHHGSELKYLLMCPCMRQWLGI